MKKTLLFLGLAAITTQQASAQSFSFGPEVGAVFNKMTYNGSGTAAGFTPTLSNVTGFKAGVLADIGLGPIAIQPGIFYSAKGGKQSLNFLGLATADVTTRVNYLEVPVWVQYKHKLGPGRAFIGLGPSVSYGISGKSKIKVSGFGTVADSSGKITFGSDSTDMKRLDYAANFNLGYELSMGLFVRIFYTLGMANLSNDPMIDTKNRSFGVSVGLLLGK